MALDEAVVAGASASIPTALDARLFQTRAVGSAGELDALIGVKAAWLALPQRIFKRLQTEAHGAIKHSGAHRTWQTRRSRTLAPTRS